VGRTSSTPLQEVDYLYNIRGWLTDINNVDNLGGDLFGFKINYEITHYPLYTGPGKPLIRYFPLYNGNIAETYWRTSTDNVLRKYGYSYDQLNRLNTAYYMKPSSVDDNSSFKNNYNESLTYDKNGNILSLYRTGDLDSNVDVIEIDDLDYLYDSGNKLLKVIDNSNHPEGFKDGANNDNEYGYDVFGNMTRDDNKGIESITYNHLNLPKKITYSTSSQNISYLYNALGVKVQKKVFRSGIVGTFNPDHTVTTDYLSGFHYEFNDNPNMIGNNGLIFFATAEGYVNVITSRSVSYNYVYNYTDHLGNVRVSYTSGTGGVASILEENHYYPFGLKHKKYGAVDKDWFIVDNDTLYAIGIDVVPPQGRKSYQYKYQGQERQDELGLNWDSFKWRNYDFAIGRFMSIDPLAEKYAYQSPYNFAENRVVDGNELEGLEWVDANGNKVYDPKANEGKGGYTEHATSTHKNLGKSLNQTPTGREQFDKLVNSVVPTTTKLDTENTPTDGNGGLVLGFTDAKISKSGYVKTEKNDSGEVIGLIPESFEITIFQKNIETALNKDGDIYGKDIPQGLLNFSKLIGVVFGHEIEHATPKDLLYGTQNPQNAEEPAIKISNKIIDELIKGE